MFYYNINMFILPSTTYCAHIDLDECVTWPMSHSVNQKSRFSDSQDAVYLPIPNSLLKEWQNLEDLGATFFYFRA